MSTHQQHVQGRIARDRWASRAHQRFTNNTGCSCDGRCGPPLPAFSPHCRVSGRDDDGHGRVIVMRWRVTVTPDHEDIAPLRRHRHLRTHGQQHLRGHMAERQSGQHRHLQLMRAAGRSPCAGRSPGRAAPCLNAVNCPSTMARWRASTPAIFNWSSMRSMRYGCSLMSSRKSTPLSTTGKVRRAEQADQHATGCRPTAPRRARACNFGVSHRAPACASRCLRPGR